MIGVRGNAVGLVIWLTGLPCCGKSTIAEELSRRLTEDDLAIKVVNLDGDVLRRGICADLGFSLKDRKENIRRVGELAALCSRSDFLTAIVSVVSPLEEDREVVKKIISYDRFCEVYINCPLEECIKRDVKGMYKLALEGKIQDFTGISSPYEPPLNSDVVCFTQNETIEESVNAIIQCIKSEDYKKTKVIKSKKGGRGIIDLSGYRFGKLFVLDKYKLQNKRTKWLCECDCKNKVWVAADALKRKDGKSTKSCGCLVKGVPKRLVWQEGAKLDLFRKYKASAKIRGFEFALTLEDFERLTSSACFYCGKNPNQIQKSRNNNGDYTYNGIDRFDNAVGYILENCVSCCKVCNKAKSGMHGKEFINLAEQITENRKKSRGRD